MRLCEGKRKKGERKGERERKERKRKKREKEEEKEERERKFRAKIQGDLSLLERLLVCPSINNVRGSEVKLFLY